MPDWDADSPRLTDNLNRLAEELGRQASTRTSLTLEMAKTWHAEIMAGLDVPNADLVGSFRGEPGAETVGVGIGPYEGVPPNQVNGELEAFQSHLTAVVEYLDEQVPAGTLPDSDSLDAVLDVCGWVHAEWVRIHPFANGNGRTARVWTNVIAMRYGLPPFVRLRPRPAKIAYARAGARAMEGDWRPTAELFRTMLDRYLAKQ